MWRTRYVLYVLKRWKWLVICFFTVELRPVFGMQLTGGLGYVRWFLPLYLCLMLSLLGMVRIGNGGKVFPWFGLPLCGCCGGLEMIEFSIMWVDVPTVFDLVQRMSWNWFINNTAKAPFLLYEWVWNPGNCMLRWGAGYLRLGVTVFGLL
jgi:hypothetical protein